MRYDVAVVGAGPAGAWTAYLLASRGARVLLADPSHPREKPCGGGVTGRALALVAPALSGCRLPAVSIRTARFVDTATNVSAAVPLAPGADNGATSALVVASRADFDGLLAAAATRAGAELLAARVTGVTRDPTGFHLETADGRTAHAAFLVGADGANSLVRRRLVQPLSRGQLSIATGFFAHGVSSDEIVIELLADPPGYIWSFPRPGHLAIGICAQADEGITAGALRARAAEWIRAAAVAPNAVLEPYSWPIPSLSAGDFETLEVAGAGWLLTGDAAGLVDPITREGIFFALQSGAHAADALGSSASHPERAYSDCVRTTIAAELARAARVKAGFFTPRFMDLLVDALGASEPIRKVMADLIAGTQSYRGLKWRLAKTFEVGLAWRFLRTL
jgi:geranylgeranyl reductase family protein